MRATTDIPRETRSVPPSRAAGGYQLIPTIQLAAAWWAYREGVIHLADLRVWFAAWEMRARRCRTPAPLPRRFGHAELERLTGLPPRRLRAATHRLEAAGLLHWAENVIGFPAAAEAIARTDAEGFRSFFDTIPNHDRRVPVPRRMLRMLAEGCRPALIATILGHLLRCLYLKSGRFQDLGRVKASWIAETFGVSIRRVREARRELVDLGWLVPLDSPQWAMNRWGALVRINLTWASPDGNELSVDDRTSLAPKLAPPAPVSVAKLAPPDSSDKEPPGRNKDQKPALAGGPSGFFMDAGKGKTLWTETRRPGRSTVERQPSAALRPATAPGKPHLRHLVPEDLGDVGRLLELYAQAVGLGLVPSSEWGRLRFVAAAEHARSIGKANPCGLFARLVRGRLLHFATECDEQAASVRIRSHLYGSSGSPPMQAPVERVEPGRKPPRVVEWSEDAQLVQAVRAASARAGYRGDPFPLLRREKPEWTRDRWDRAVAELGR